MGSLFNPTSIFHSLQTIRHPPVKNILTGFEGVVRPGEMLLVLGSPGSGCSTLLKILANHRSEYRSISGSVYYDSLSPDEVAKHYRGDVVYCPEDDVHFPTLTVEETLSFAAKTRAPRNRIDQHTRAQYMRLNTDLLTTVFGLKHASNTVVGDASIRGVSGGEKKRVSIAENLASRCLVGAWDKLSLSSLSLSHFMLIVLGEALPAG
jgi:ATP-binding cassette subfamily G (WHITE) protein 2 (SNQ2)